jgi:hypothetical protein
MLVRVVSKHFSASNRARHSLVLHERSFSIFFPENSFSNIKLHVQNCQRGEARMSRWADWQRGTLNVAFKFLGNVRNPDECCCDLS